MIRVCQVVGNMNGGGVEAVVMNYYRHIDRTKVQFDFIVTENSTIVPREEMEFLGGRVFMVPAYTKLPQFQNACYELFREHQEWKIVHAHMNALNVFHLKEAKRANVPVRISHSHSTAGKGETVKNVAKTILRPFANVYPTERFACGQYAGEWLFGKKTSFTLMRNAVDLKSFAFSDDKRIEARAEFGANDDTFVVGHLGRFMEQKNHAFLLTIFAELLKEKPNSLLVLAGSGPLFNEIQMRARELGIAHQVLFLGQRADADKLYCGFDVFCLPSLYEGLPVVGIEAQASGLPFVISDQVTDEIIITSRTKRLRLIDGASAWAHQLAEMDDGRRILPLSEDDRDALSDYDVELQGKWLTSKYLGLSEGYDIASK